MHRVHVFASVFATVFTACAAAKNETSYYGRLQITEVSYEQLSASDARSKDDVFDSSDWIELFNPSETETVNITGWAFTDRSARRIKKRPTEAKKHWFVFPKLLLPPKSFRVLARDEMAFRRAYRGRPRAIDALVRGEFGFGLSDKGERLRIVDERNETVFEFKYDDKAPWPDTREGGHSLEIIDVRLDPNLAYSWITSKEQGGTPGEINSVSVAW
jgi:hypothetical protein|tara:strand:- start:1933 stop:2580 length:648 start_codon:yes stop_codon:yes gene_type:complete